MVCLYCNDNRVIWHMDHGKQVCKPCPYCNKDGKPVAVETEKAIEKNWSDEWREIHNTDRT